jgi:uncharacterized protein (DUF1778 family)
MSKQKSGGRRLTESGQTVVNFGITNAERDLIDQAAAIVRRPRAAFIRYAALVEAKRILAKK